MVLTVKSLNELKEIKQNLRQSMNIREQADADTKILVGMATCGIAAGAKDVLTVFIEEIAKYELTNVMVTQTGCIGLCQYEPVVEIISAGKEKITYGKVTPEIAKQIVEEHILNGNIISQYTINAAAQ